MNPLVSLAAVVPCLIQTPTQPREPARVRVVVDPRVELVAVVEYLSGYAVRPGLITSYDVDYKRDVEAAFARFRAHRAVKLFDELSREGFAFDAPIAAVLHCDAPPALAPRTAMDESIASRAGSPARLDEFLGALRDFARESELQSFLDRERALFNSIEAEGRASLAAVDAGMLESYFGETRSAYTIVLSPLLHHGGFGPRIRMPDGSMEVYSVGGPHAASGGKPTFGTQEEFRYVVWHEFGHSFVNPLVERFGERIDRTDVLYDALRDRMHARGYGNWRTCVYEHIVRACTVRFTFRELGATEGKKALEEETSKGFAHLPALCAKLEEYEHDRARWPSLAAFFPQLVLVFERAVAEVARDPALQRPRVLGTIPRTGDPAVDPGLNEIVVEFDRDMEPSSFAWIQLDAATYPRVCGAPRFLSARTCVLPVALERGRAYRIGLNSTGIEGFQAKSGRAAESYEIEFRTSP
jgi:hypothetical protein